MLPMKREINGLRADLGVQQAKQLGPTLGEFYGQFFGLPGLRGLWYPGSQDQTGAIYDQSGQGRTLTYNGDPQLNIYNDLISYYDLDGTGDYFSRPDEAGLDITGTETTFVSALRGLTLGGWFWTDDLSNAPALLSKFQFTAGNQRSYNLLLNTAGTLRSSISSDGTSGNQQNVDSSNAIAEGEWFFAAGRFTPSTELAVFLNDTKTTFTTAVKASLFNSTAAFQLGAMDAGTRILNGNFALAFLAATAWPDTLLAYLFNRSRPLFGI